MNPSPPRDTGHIPRSLHSIRRIPALDGLRGIAIIVVLFWHYFLPSWFPGWSGVDLFFVLSGYLITGNLLAAKGQPHYFTRFYRNRALRILPLYYALLIGFFLAIRFLVHQRNLPDLAFYTDHWKSFFILTQNWTIAFHGLPRNLSMAPTWSLAIEEQFYLIWPLIILLIPGDKPRIRLFTLLIILIFLSRTLGYLFISRNEDLYYFATFFHMDGLIIGALLYQIHRSEIKIATPVLTWCLLLLTIILALGCISARDVDGTSPFFETVGFTFVALWYGLLLHISVKLPDSLFTRSLNWSFLRYCGKISYGLYLIHYPVLFFAGFRFYFWALGHWPDKSGILHVCMQALCILATFLLSSLSYRYFESRFLRLKR